MKQICFNIDADLDEQFRDIIFKKKGMRRGAMVDALHEAVKLWIIVNKDDKPNPKLQRILNTLDTVEINSKQESQRILVKEDQNGN